MNNITREDVLQIAEACGLGTLHHNGLWGAGFAEPARLVAFAHAIAARPAAPALVDGKLPRHKFWGAGEPDCPAELKAPNGELHTMRCKVCGDGWRESSDVCFGPATAGVTGMPHHLRRDEVIALISPLSNNSADHDIEFAYRVMHALGVGGNDGR